MSGTHGTTETAGPVPGPVPPEETESTGRPDADSHSHLRGSHAYLHPFAGHADPHPCGHRHPAHPRRHGLSSIAKRHETSLR